MGIGDQKVAGVRKTTRMEKIDGAFFIVLYLVYTIGMFFLFHRQSVEFGGKYLSDMPSYLEEIQGIDSGYSFPYPIMFWTAEALLPFFSPSWALCIAVTFLNGLTPFALKYFFDKNLGVNERDGMRFLSTIAVFSLLAASMLYPLQLLDGSGMLGGRFVFRYLGTFSPNPYHNSTYLSARPFAVVTFFLYLRILEKYEESKQWICPEYVAFSAFLLLATMTKPSFTLVLVIHAGLTMVFRLFKGRFRNWKAFLQYGIWFIPTFIDLLYQYGGVFIAKTGEEEKGVGLALFKAWHSGCTNIPRAVLLGTAFPIVVFLFHLPTLLKKGNTRKELSLGWQFFLVSFGTFALLYEKGERMVHMNFSWGYMYGLFFLYTMSLLALLKDSFFGRKECVKAICQWSVYGLHLVCGVAYLWVLLKGGIFM